MYKLQLQPIHSVIPHKVNEFAAEHERESVGNILCVVSLFQSVSII